MIYENILWRGIADGINKVGDTIFLFIGLL
jgi:hypothetical protein